MNSDKSTVKIVIGIVTICIASLGIYMASQPKVPNGVYGTSDGTYLYDFQTGGTGSSEFYLNSIRGGLRREESTPFKWQIQDEIIWVDLDNPEKGGCGIKWDRDDLIIQGSNTRLIKK